jgi:hypothetical protein
LAFLIGLFGGSAVAGAVGGGELVIQFPDPAAIGVVGASIQQRPGAGCGQPRTAGTGHHDRPEASLTKSTQQ